MAELSFDLSSGRVAAQRWGDETDPLVLCVHGLTANLTGFSWLAEGLVRRGLQVVAIDCRGRGRSEATAPGTYGFEAHADDVLEIAAQLKTDHFSYVGWSMGALVGMFVARRSPDALRNVVLLDALGPMGLDAVNLVEASLGRLELVVSSPEEYVDVIRSRGVIEPWTPFWTAHYTYELVLKEDGRWTPSTSRDACAEDLEGAAGHDFPALWPGLTMPTKLVRAEGRIAGAQLVAPGVRDAFLAAAPGASVVEVPTNHYTVMTDPEMLSAAAATLAGAG